MNNIVNVQTQNYKAGSYARSIPKLPPQWQDILSLRRQCNNRLSFTASRNNTGFQAK